MGRPSGWVEVRCPSPTCDQAGGRVLFTRSGSLVVKAGRNGSIMVEGVVLGAICPCGYRWRDPSLIDEPALTP